MKAVNYNNTNTNKKESNNNNRDSTFDITDLSDNVTAQNIKFRTIEELIRKKNLAEKYFLVLQNCAVSFIKGL